MTPRQKLLQDYLFELVFALQMKCNGTTVVMKEVSPLKKATPIDDYIRHWEDGVNILKDESIEVDLEEFNY